MEHIGRYCSLQTMTAEASLHGSSSYIRLAPNLPEHFFFPYMHLALLAMGEHPWGMYVTL